MIAEVVSRRPGLVIRRLVLAPGEAMFWHRDVCQRFSVVVRGQQLTIEYADGGPAETFPVSPGDAGWDEPEARLHRAVNTGSVTFEEVVSFQLPADGIDPQPST